MLKNSRNRQTMEGQDEKKRKREEEYKYGTDKAKENQRVIFSPQYIRSVAFLCFTFFGRIFLFGSK